MTKRYDPILCMMVDEPTKAKDAMPGDLKKAGYEVGTVEKYGSTFYTLVYNGKVISTSPTEANIVEKAKKHYANRHDKVHDATPINVTKVIKSATSKLGKTYYIIQDDNGYYWVTTDKTGHGGGTMSIRISSAVSDLKAFVLMDNLEKKYGKAEGYRRFMKGETDECPEGMTCDKSMSEMKIDELRDLAVSLGADKNKLYGTSKQALIIIVNNLKKKTKDEKAVDKAIRMCDAVEVETSRWSFSSGKSKPSGFGNWWFKIGTEEKNFSGNWSSAKAEAIKYAKEKGISRISLMT